MRRCLLEASVSNPPDPTAVPPTASPPTAPPPGLARRIGPDWAAVIVAAVVVVLAVVGLLPSIPFLVK
jgi:hypothetical protein